MLDLTDRPQRALKASDTEWLSRAACKAHPDWWTDGTPATAQWAVHICRRHCPVLDQCGADTRRFPPFGVIQAGQLWAAHTLEARPAISQPKPIGHGLWCGRPEPIATPPQEQPPPQPTRGRDPAPCGTAAGYRRHQRRGELVDDACRQAVREYRAAYKAMRRRRRRKKATK